MRGFIVKEDSMLSKRAEIIQDPKSLKEIGHEISLRILKLIAKKAMYPAQIAKELKINEQKVYYHISNLASANFIEVVEKTEIRGTTAKKYLAKSPNFAISLDDSWEPMNLEDKKENPQNKKLELFLSPFIKEGKLNSKFVVGSPDPHGPFKAYARDGHYATELALFLGGYCTNPHNFAVNLDVDLKREKETNQNLILIGGPVTNTVVSDINNHLQVKFSDKKPWGLFSENTGKKYTNDSVGVIAKIPNPHFPSGSILLFAGIRQIGTKAAVMALTKANAELLKDYHGQATFTKVVEGFDLDGDGKIDNVEVLE